jgi:hypothetical protein
MVMSRLLLPLPIVARRLRCSLGPKRHNEGIQRTAKIRDLGVTMRFLTLFVLALLAGCGGKSKSDPHRSDGGGGGQAGSGVRDATGGSRSTGGTDAIGGSRATGGTRVTGGSRATGGTRVTGGSRSTGGTDATGGTHATGGSPATGGTPAAGGTPNASCPEGVPARGAECDGDPSCSYITAVKDCCNETATATCVDGAWDVKETDCDCPEGTGGTTMGTGGASAGGADAGAGGYAGPGGAAGAMPDEWFECDKSDDCGVSSESCCGQCGAYTSQDVIAIRRDSLSSYVDTRCGTSFGCPACAAAVLSSITAVCRAGRCAVADLSQDPMTACTRDDECRVRSKDCCECGGNLYDLVAIATSAASSYVELVCEEGWGCDACLPSYDKTARCDGGHCVVELL